MTCQPVMHVEDEHVPCWLSPAAGFVKDAAINEWGHAVLANALSVVDDTSLLTKVIVAELKVRHACWEVCWFSTSFVSLRYHPWPFVLVCTAFCDSILCCGPHEPVMTPLPTGGLKH
jgi:hypothetical protein